MAEGVRELIEKSARLAGDVSERVAASGGGEAGRIFTSRTKDGRRVEVTMRIKVIGSAELDQETRKR